MKLHNELLELRKKGKFPGCEETHFLQFDHVLPVRKGGGAVPKNLQVLCSAHNNYKGWLWTDNTSFSRRLEV